MSCVIYLSDKQIQILIDILTIHKSQVLVWFENYEAEYYKLLDKLKSKRTNE